MRKCEKSVRAIIYRSPPRTASQLPVKYEQNVPSQPNTFFTFMLEKGSSYSYFFHLPCRWGQGSIIYEKTTTTRHQAWYRTLMGPILRPKWVLAAPLLVDLHLFIWYNFPPKLGVLSFEVAWVISWMDSGSWESSIYIWHPWGWIACLAISCIVERFFYSPHGCVFLTKLIMAFHRTTVISSVGEARQACTDFSNFLFYIIKKNFNWWGSSFFLFYMPMRPTFDVQTHQSTVNRQPARPSHDFFFFSKKCSRMMYVSHIYS
jgi:hypothetical protein